MDIKKGVGFLIYSFVINNEFDKTSKGKILKFTGKFEGELTEVDFNKLDRMSQIRRGETFLEAIEIVKTLKKQNIQDILKFIIMDVVDELTDVQQRMFILMCKEFKIDYNEYIEIDEDEDEEDIIEGVDDYVDDFKTRYDD